MKISFAILCFAALVFGLSACQSNTGAGEPTPDAAKQDLVLRGFKFDEESFVRAVKQNDQRAVNAFLSAGINVNGKNAGGETALTAAVNKQDAKTVKLLLDKGKADANQTDAQGNTPLYLALVKNNYEIADALVAANADVNKPAGPDKQTAFYIAVNAAQADLINKMLERSPDVNAADKNGETAIIAAAVNNDLATVKELIKRGADLNRQSKSGGSALIYAASSGYAEIAKELLAAGAKKDLKDAKGRTALDWAKQNKRADIAAMLQEGR